MKTDLKKIIKKRFLMIWIFAVSAMLICLISYAAYTNLNSVKRVVSTQGGSGTAFSSNYLALTPYTNDNNGSYDSKRISISKGSPSKKISITVCNYVQNNPSVVNENDITYTLKLTLVDPISGEAITDKDSDVEVSFGGINYEFKSGVCTIESQTLAGKTKNVNTYAVTVPNEFIDTVNIKAEAVPDGDSLSHTNNQMLGRIFTFSEYSESATAWTGAFSEKTTDDYDGFNYIVKGQGKGTVTITWDTDKLEMNKFFYVNLSITPTEETDGKKSLSFEVDSDINRRYDIQFYKTQNEDYSDINKVNSYVTFRFEESKSAAETTTTADVG